MSKTLNENQLWVSNQLTSEPEEVSAIIFEDFEEGFGNERAWTLGASLISEDFESM